MLSRDCPPRDGPPRDCPSRPGPPLRESPSKDLAPEGRALERGDEGRALEGRPDEGRSFEGRPDEGRAGPRDGPASSRSPRYAGRSRRGAPLVPDVRDVRAAGAPGRAGRVGRPEPSEDDPPSVPVDRAGRADEDVRVVAFVRLAEAGRAGRPSWGLPRRNATSPPPFSGRRHSPDPWGLRAAGDGLSHRRLHRRSRNHRAPTGRDEGVGGNQQAFQGV